MRLLVNDRFPSTLEESNSSCLAGGVFFAAGLIHLLVDSDESFEALAESNADVSARLLI